MNISIGVAALVLAAAPPSHAAEPSKPTIVLVYGSFETSDAAQL
jgi:hypothetical protein